MASGGRASARGSTEECPLDIAAHPQISGRTDRRFSAPTLNRSPEDWHREVLVCDMGHGHTSASHRGDFPARKPRRRTRCGARYMSLLAIHILRSCNTVLRRTPIRRPQRRASCAQTRVAVAIRESASLPKEVKKVLAPLGLPCSIPPRLLAWSLWSGGCRATATPVHLFVSTDHWPNLRHYWRIATSATVIPRANRNSSTSR
jgi:hypothetical protein